MKPKIKSTVSLCLVFPLITSFVWLAGFADTVAPQMPYDDIVYFNHNYPVQHNSQQIITPAGSPEVYGPIPIEEFLASDRAALMDPEERRVMEEKLQKMKKYDEEKVTLEIVDFTFEPIQKAEGPVLSFKENYDSVVYISEVLRFYEITLEGLEDRASAIVRGRLGDDAMIACDPRDESPRYNVVSLEILDVYKGNLKIGETIKIIEPYYIKDRILWARGNYLPSRPNQEYIFFLGNQAINPSAEEAKGAHFIMHYERGRYLVPEEDRYRAGSYSREELSLGELDTELYMNLYQDVINTYLQ